MKKYHSHLSVAASSVALLFALAPAAQAMMLVKGDNTAAVVDSNVTIDAHADLKATATPVDGVRMEGGVNTAGGIRTSGDGKMETGEGNYHDMDSDADGMSDRNVHATGTVRAEEEANTHATVGLENAVLHIGAADLDHDGLDARVTTASEVHNKTDLQAFVAAKAKADDRIKSVDVENGKVSVAYDEDAKLFGFMKTKVAAHATADVNGNVSVKYPWYHIFMTKAETSASLQSDIARAIAAERKGEKEGVASTTMQAEISTAMGIPNLFEIVVNALHGASMQGSVTGQATAAAE